MDGLGNSTYFLAVFLEMPICLAMPLRGTPYAGRYPVLDLFNEFQAASDSGHAAVVAAAKRMRAGTNDQQGGRLPR